MTKERAFEVECELLEECREYIDNGSEPRNETMEACVQAFEAIQKYRIILEKEVRRAATQADKE